MDIWCSMISYLNLSSGVYIPLYWVFVIKIFNIYCFFKPNWWMLKIWSPKHHWTVPSMKWISLYHLYAACMRWISGGFFVKKHLTQDTLSCEIPSPLGKILNFAPTILQCPWLARGATPGASRWHVHYSYTKYNCVFKIKICVYRFLCFLPSSHHDMFPRITPRTQFCARYF